MIRIRPIAIACTYQHFLIEHAPHSYEHVRLQHSVSLANFSRISNQLKEICKTEDIEILPERIFIWDESNKAMDPFTDEVISYEELCKRITKTLDDNYQYRMSFVTAQTTSTTDSVTLTINPNVVKLRNNNDLKVGDKVKIKGSDSVFEVGALGYGNIYGADEDLRIEGKMMNSREFVQLKVPAHGFGVFPIHKNYIEQV